MVGPGRYTLYPSERRYGAWLPGGGGHYIPLPRDYQALGGAVHPYWHVINHPLAARATEDSAILPEDDFTWLTLAASATEPERSFRAGFYQVIDAETGYRLSRAWVNGENYMGSALRPFILQRPFPLPNRRILINTTQNMRNAENTVQIVIGGVKEYRGALAP